ncbi:FtsX-like permease family protein [Clostridium paraputrificum]|uniref:FtsX-like permease family protein n=1 Tax=Clostridium paraputrificum TaxID=29363 RepID=UPI003D331715
MGIFKYTLMTFRKDFKNNLFYILAMTVSIAIIFNTFNLIFNENIVIRKSADYHTMFLLGLVIQAVAILFMLFANSYYLEDKYKEYGVITISGRSVFEISKIIMIRNIISSTLSVILGCVIGGIVSPLITARAYSLIGFDGSPRYISQTGIVMTCIIIATQFMFVILVNTGNVYRKKVTELMKGKNQPFMPDKRNIKLKPKNYIIIFLLPVLLFLIPFNPKDKMYLLTVLIVICSFGTQGIVRYVIPTMFSEYKNKKLVTDRIKLISISNLHYSLQKSTYLILSLVLATSFTIAIACSYESGSILSVISLVCFAVVVVILSFTIVYKFLVEALKRRKNYKQLRLLGYTKNEIRKVIFQEVIIYYFIIIAIALVHMSLVIITSVSAGLLAGSLAIGLVSAYILTFVITGVLSYIGYRKLAV